MVKSLMRNVKASHAAAEGSIWCDAWALVDVGEWAEAKTSRQMSPSLNS